MRKNGKFDDQPKYIDTVSWRKCLQKFDAEILRSAQDDTVPPFSAACEAVP